MHSNNDHHDRDIPEEFQDDVQEWTKSIESEQFAHGVSFGESIGAYETYEEAVRAYEAGEIDQWFAFQKPKTREEWAAWEEEHGKGYEKRWEK